MSVNMTAFVSIDHSHINEQDICIENKRKKIKQVQSMTVLLKM